MSQFGRPGIERIVVAGPQLTPDWRMYVAPIRGMNSMVPEWYLHPEDGYAPLIKNFLPTLEGTLRKRKGIRKITSISDNDYPIEFFQLGDHEGKVHTLALTEGRELRKFTQDSNAWINVGRQIDISSVLTASPKAAFFGIIEGTGKTFLFITSNDFTNPVTKYEIKYDSNGNLDNSGAVAAGDFTDPGGEGDNDGWTILNAQHLTAYKNFLILCNTKEQVEGQTTIEHYPYRFRWSNYGQPEDFRDTLNHVGGYIDLDDDNLNGPILTTLNLRSAMVVYKPNAVYNMALRSDGSFYKEIKVKDRGLVSAKAVDVVRNGTLHLCVGHDNIYLYDGFDFQEPPVGNKIRSFFYKQRLDWANIDTLYVKSFPDRNECWVFFDARANSTLGLSAGREAICWNWERNAWTWHNLGLRSAFAGVSIADSDTQVTRSPYYLGGLDGTGSVRLFEHPYDLTNNASGTIEGMIVFPLIHKMKMDKPIQHAFEDKMFLQATMGTDSNSNDTANHYELWMRHADNPTLRVSDTQAEAVSASAIREDIAGTSDVPWHESELIQFQPSHEDMPPPKYYQGLVLIANSRQISEEVSLIRFKTVEKEGRISS